MSGAGALLLVLFAWALGAFALYWVIRLAVRHALEDARRLERVERSATGVSETIRRQRATYGGDEG
jgi:cytochrome c biogenesis protein CcdA